MNIIKNLTVEQINYALEDFEQPATAVRYVSHTSFDAMGFIRIRYEAQHDNDNKRDAIIVTLTTRDRLIHPHAKPVIEQGSMSAEWDD